MNRYASVGRNTGWLLAGRVASQALAVLFTVLLAGRLGLVGLGEYAFVAAIVFLANVVTTFGTDMVLVRDIASGGPMARWSAALAVQLGLSLGAIALIWLAAPFVPGQGADVVGALRIYSLSLIPCALFSVCTAVLRGAGRMGWQASLGVAAALVQLVAAWLLVAEGSSLQLVATVLLGVQVAGAALGWAICAALFPEFRTVPRSSTADVSRMIGSAASIGLLGVLGVLYQRAGVLVLAVAAGPAATGWFAGASRVVEASKTGHVAFFGALYPLLARAHARSDRRDAARIDRLRLLSLAVAAALSAGLLVTGPVIIHVLYGPAFGPSATGLAILALTTLPSTLATFLSLELLAAHGEAFTLRALLVSLGALGGLLALLIPALGWLGGCWAVLGAEIVQAGTLLVVRRQALGAGASRHGTVALARQAEGAG